MKAYAWEEFVLWAADRDVRISSGSAGTLIQLPRENPYRFWEYPSDRRQYRGYAETLLDACDPWQGCFVYFEMLSWFDSSTNEYAFQVSRRELQELGIVLEKDSIVHFDFAERSALLSALEHEMEDLSDCSLVFDHALQTIKFDHHAVATIHCRTQERLEEIVSALEARRIALPAGPPDWTFKPQAWFKGH
jgi:hypothetical protein